MKNVPRHGRVRLVEPALAAGETVSDKLVAIQVQAAARRHFFRFHASVRLNDGCESEDDSLSQGSALDVSYRGERLTGQVWGEGPTVLCVHGRLGRGAQFRGFVRPLTDAGFRIIVFDAPGHGHSHGMFVHTDFVVLAIALIEQRYGPLHALVSHSMGTVWSLAALGAGVAAKRLICLNPLAHPEAALREYTRRSRLAPAVAQAFAEMVRRFNHHAMQTSVEVSRRTLSGIVMQSEQDPFVSSVESRIFADAWGLDFEPIAGDDHEEILYDDRVQARCVECLRDVTLGL